MDAQSLVNALRMTHGPQAPTGAQRVMQGGLPLAAAATGAAIPAGLTDALSQGLGPALQSRGMPAPVASLVDALSSPLNPSRAMPGPGELGATLPAGTLRNLLDQGLSYSQIAKQLGVSRNVVAGNMRDLGLSSPTGTRDAFEIKGVTASGYGRTKIVPPAEREVEARDQALIAKDNSPGDNMFNPAQNFARPAPSTPQIPFQQQPAPEADPEMARIMADYLAKMGLGQ